MAGKTLQQGEPGSELSELNDETVQEQMAEIGDKSEREKIPLSKEVEDYARENFAGAQMQPHASAVGERLGGGRQTDESGVHQE